jgi:hypothetical protein
VAPQLSVGWKCFGWKVIVEGVIFGRVVAVIMVNETQPSQKQDVNAPSLLHL